jgi:hypothetical protein
MWIKILFGAVGAGALFGAVGANKVNKFANRVTNKVKPRKNRVAVVEVELEEDQQVSDLAFLVVKGVPKGASKDVVETLHVDTDDDYRFED